MGLRKDLNRKIEKKLQEIKELELKVREEQAYVQGLQDTLKMIPREGAPARSVELRHGSDVAKARDSIIKAGCPMHLRDLLRDQGKPVDKKHRLALGGSLARYARQGMVFVKTAPNTYGLLKLNHSRSEPADEDVPSDFGLEEV